MADFRAMTDSELGRWIAERRGYKVLMRDELPGDVRADFEAHEAENAQVLRNAGLEPEPRARFFLRIPGEGSVYHYREKHGGAIEEVWETAQRWYYEIEPDIPEWTSDLNVAWTLLGHMPVGVALETLRALPVSDAKCAARAICEIWAAQQEDA